MSMSLVRFLPVDTKFEFIKARFIAFILSSVVILTSAVAMFGLNLNFGIDFRGGTLLEISLEDDIDLGAIRNELGALNLGDVQVQEFGAKNIALIRVETLSAEDVSRVTGRLVEGDEAAQQIVNLMVQDALNTRFENIDYRRVEVVGPQVSGELVVAGSVAVVVALALMLIYIWLRFEWQYSVGAVLALSHDVIATIGFFAITQLEFNLSTIAAILTIVGYSMNDTVVVYDRIREEFRKYKSLPTPDVLNMAINRTLSRTILTSGTTLIAIIAMALIGGPALQGFALALIWGVVIGTYSSIFVAAPLLTLTGVRRESGEE